MPSNNAGVVEDASSVLAQSIGQLRIFVGVYECIVKPVIYMVEHLAFDGNIGRVKMAIVVLLAVLQVVVAELLRTRTVNVFHQCILGQIVCPAHPSQDCHSRVRVVAVCAQMGVNKIGVGHNIIAYKDKKRR